MLHHLPSGIVIVVASTCQGEVDELTPTGNSARRPPFRLSLGSALPTGTLLDGRGKSRFD